MGPAADTTGILVPTMTSSPYLDAVRDRVVIFDGAAGTWLQQQDLAMEDYGTPELEGCPEILNETRPELIAQMHREYLAAGADVVETNSFGGMRATLGEYGLGERTEELNEMAARIARDVADEFSTPDRPRFVAGSIGPGTRFASLGHVRYEELRDQVAEQARGLLRGGVDLLLLETQFDLLGIKAGMNGCRDAMADVGREVPIQTQVTIELTGRMLPGTEIGAALVALDAMRPDVIGINCATGPEEMSEHVRHLSAHSRIPISVLPNAGLPSVVDGHMHYDLSAEQFVEFHRRFITEFGVNVVGGCCGTTPEYIRQLADAVAEIEPADRRPHFEHGVSSIYSPVLLEHDDDGGASSNLIMIGERTNANGSKKFREAMLDGDWDTCVAMAKDQVKEGSHIIDVCVDYVGRDGAADMDEIAQRFATQSSVPLVLDSTEPEVLEAGLRWLGGRAILNSANLEDGDAEGSRADRVLKLAKEYGAAVIVLLIDEEGQARDVEWKMRVAHRIHDLAVERYGLEPQDLIFDALTFPLSTGDDDLRRDGIATIEAIRRIKAELPGVSTTLGLSNVSFGLKPAARHVLNSVFLAECVKAGLDSAIVHAAKILPLNRIPAEQRDVCMDLIWDRRGTEGALSDGDAGYDPLHKLLEIFADVQTTEVVVEDRSDWPIEQRLSQRIIDGDRDGLVPDLEVALADGHTPLAIINDILLAGMKVVGELFATGEMQLPFVLQSAETMKMAVAHLEPMMDRVEGETGKGRIVLATVKGDVHDIGKNLVDIILTNNGYEVHNLGIKISITEMIDKATRGQRRRDRHVGVAGEVDADHARQPRGAEPARPVTHPRGAGRRGAHPHLRRARPARGLRGPVVLRQGCVRGPAGDGPPRRDPSGQARRRRRHGALRARAAPPPHRRPGRDTGRGARPLPRGGDRQPGLRAALPGLEGHQGHLDRRDRRVHQRDRAVPQPVAVPTGGAPRRHQGGRRAVQGPHPSDPARAARRGQGRGAAHPTGRPRLLRRQLRRRRPGAVHRRVPHHRADPLLLPPPTGRAVPVHRRLLPAGRLGRGGLRGVPHRDDGRGHLGARRRAVRCRQVPGLPAAARPGRRDGRGARRVLAPPHPHRVGLRRRGPRTDHRRRRPRSR